MVTCEISLNKRSFFLSQEKMLDMESDLEELHDSEQRWAAKHKRAIEQVDHRLPKPADFNIFCVQEKRLPQT